jgi:hypothetical protein
MAAEQIDVLARKLAGDAADPECLFFARKVAEMELMLGCICAARVNLINAQLPQQGMVISGDRGLPSGAADPASVQGDRCNPGAHCMTGYEGVDALLQALPDLLRLERYEAAALAGRRRALLQLMCCWHGAASGPFADARPGHGRDRPRL